MLKRFSLTVFLVFMGLTMLAAPALTEDVTLSWTPPLNQIHSCVEEPIEGLAGYRIYRMIAEVDDPAIDEYVVSGLEVGEHKFAATAYNDQGQESVLSGQASKTVDQIVTTDTSVYDILKRGDRFVTLRVGSIPLGVPCDFTQSVMGMYVVPVSEVTFEGGRPPVVVAQCR